MDEVETPTEGTYTKQSREEDTDSGDTLRQDKEQCRLHHTMIHPKRNQ
jgi:hypothetical protein